MRFEPTVFSGPPPEGEPATIQVLPEDWVPRLNTEDVQRGVVFLQMPDGTLREAHTVVDPETGGLYAEPKD